MINVRELVLVLKISVFVMLLTATLVYRHHAQQAHDQYIRLQGSIEQQTAQASAKLAQLTAERDAKQTQLNQLAKEQEVKDAAAQSEIARLDDELRNRPIRVRVVTRSGGGGGGSAKSDAATTPEAGAGDTATAYGLLPEENSRRLADALIEVETMSAAYSSCRATLLNPTIASGSRQPQM